MSYQLIQASAHAIPLAGESVQTCVTSPPYWGLREYAGEQGVAWADGDVQPLGLEPTPELYVEHMVEVFREVMRVLRPDGTLWLNLGDTFSSGGRTTQVRDRFRDAASGKQDYLNGTAVRAATPPGMKPKDLVGIPWMVAFALRADGWYLRSDIIWNKPNPMPESVTDRPTKAHEYIFLLSKSPRYYFDQGAVREEASPASIARISQVNFANQTGGPKDYRNGINPNRSARQTLENFANNPGRNIRTVWEIATQPYAGAHFATFPRAIPDRCIKAGSSATACGVCGAPWERVTERGETLNRTTQNGDGNGELGSYGRFGDAQSLTTGWQPTCEHNDDTGASVVLDPFNGSGTTGRAAVALGRDYVGLDVSREYLDLALERIDPIMATARNTEQGTLL